jgi:hypothetical protein
LNWFALGSSIELLSSDDVASLHLGVLNLDLGVVEDVIIVIDVLYNFNWLLLLTLFLWLRRHIAFLMCPVQMSVLQLIQ